MSKKPRLEGSIAEDQFSEGLFDIETTDTSAQTRQRLVQSFATTENDAAVVRSPLFRNFVISASADELANLRDDLHQQMLTGGYVVHPDVLAAIEQKIREIRHVDMVVSRKLYKSAEARFRPSGKNYKRPPP